MLVGRLAVRAVLVKRLLGGEAVVAQVVVQVLLLAGLELPVASVAAEEVEEVRAVVALAEQVASAEPLTSSYALDNLERQHGNPDHRPPRPDHSPTRRPSTRYGQSITMD